MARGPVRFEPVSRKIADLTAFTLAVEAAIEETVKSELHVMEVLMNRPTKTWKPKNYPTWKRTIKTTRKGTTGEIRTSSTPYVFVALGTRVRFAVMESGYRRRTRPGSLMSYPGRGNMLFVGTRPKPGIEARNWHKIVAKKEARPFARRIEATIVGLSKKFGVVPRRRVVSTSGFSSTR